MHFAQISIIFSILTARKSNSCKILHWSLLLKKVTETEIILKFKCKKKSETLLKIHFFHKKTLKNNKKHFFHKKTLKNSFLMTYDPFFF